MAGTVPHILYQIGVVYLIAGGCFAAIFLAVGLERVDPAARGSLAFRPLLVPGLMLLWPLAAGRWLMLAHRAE